ncbi:MAG: hypothetical protein K2X27_15390 [Candidatus Obscuribacterales bacterium]|nr:hypothetical protein [Candidatus Obscuribacterales bacterium]
MPLKNASRSASDKDFYSSRQSCLRLSFSRIKIFKSSNNCECSRHAVNRTFKRRFQKYPLESNRKNSTGAPDRSLSAKRQVTISLTQLLGLQLCESSPDLALSEYFQKLTGSLNVHNIFNPSFYCDDYLKIFAFRAIPDGNDFLASFVSIEDRHGQKTINLSIDYYKQLGGVRLIDPKICKIHDSIYITFNTGHINSGNDIYVMKLYPELEQPKKIIFKQRNLQERNWAFFSEGQEIFALYSINPLQILKLKNVDENSWEMEEYYEGKPSGKVPQELSIGTQLCKHQGKYYFLAHKKFLERFRKKIYLGKFCSLDFTNKTISCGPDWFMHSFKSFFGSRLKHNSKLLSCTYFSGLQLSDNKVRVGYGINDVAYGFSTFPLEILP